MKQLVIGIDGGDARIFGRYQMPFINALIRDHPNICLTEDLFSRGWAEMLSGKHGRETGAFYMYPLLDKTREFAINFNLETLRQNSNSPLLWEVVERTGNRVGMMNVPTTFPAPKVRGFFVSGAGGGGTKFSGIPREMVSDSGLIAHLQKSKYIVDLRLLPSGIGDIDELFDALEAMMRSRTRAFVELCHAHRIDFGFIVFRAPVVLTYLAMSEILAPKGGSSHRWRQNLPRFFEKFDQHLRNLFEELNPEQFIITADHGTERQEFHTNYNPFLEDYGFLRRKPTVRSSLNFGKKAAKNVLRIALKRPAGTVPPLTEVDWGRTRAFGHWYYNGIYVNDRDRFGGPVGSADVDRIAIDVCAALNASTEFERYGYIARPYRKQYRNAPFFDRLPDVWIDAPDAHFFFCRQNRKVARNPWYGPIRSIRNLPSSMYTGTKGRHPICCCDRQTASLVRPDDDLNLTLVYKLVQRTFSNGE